MSADLDKSTGAQMPSDDLRGLIELIASEVLIEDYEVICKKQQFTGDNYCGDISRVQIIPHKGKKDQKVLHLFVKTAATDSNSRNALPLHTIYVAEMFAYTEIIPAFYRLNDEYNISSEDRFLSAPFYKGINEEFKEIIILKDLTEDGFIMTDKRSTFDYDHAALVLQTMARMHAASFVMKEKHPEQFDKLTDQLPKKNNFGEHLMSMIENIAAIMVGHIECPKNRAKVDEKVVSQIRLIYTDIFDAALSEPHNVICHGDSWSNNMLFKYKDGKVDQVVLIDWQIIRYSSPLADICYMLCLSTDPHLLDTHLDQLLDLYYETLRLSMKDMGCDVEKSFSKDVFMEDFRRFMLLGLSVVVGVTPIGMCEPEDVKQLGDYNSKEGNNPLKELHISELAVRRVNDLVDFFVKNDLL